MPWLLIFIGLILIILNVLAIKKHNRTFNGVLGNAIGNIDDEDIRIGELRREFSESILELQSEIMGMKEIMEKNNKLNKNYNSHIEEENSNFNKIKEIQPISTYPENVVYKEDIDNNYNKKEVIMDLPSNSNSNSNSEKIQKIKKLFTEGLSEDEISEIMHLGKGEVLLIKDLYIR